MTTKVLVAYGTKNGSTAGIADMIAAELTAGGITVDVQPAAQVRSLDGYDAVVLGGALYTGRWHRDARRFARHYATALRGRPVWIFSSGPLDDSADTTQIPPVAQAARAAQQLNARQHVTFGGRLADNAKGFVARAMIRNGHGGDHRNPQRIRTWSRSIATTLQHPTNDSTMDPNDGGQSS
jgi:menaquinone-dependent protoporphyrinogen oxidase